MPLVFALVPKFRTKLRHAPKPRRGCLFIDRAPFSRPFFLFFGGANLDLVNLSYMEWLGTFGLCIALPKNKKKGNVFAMSLYKQAPLRGLELQLKAVHKKNSQCFE